MERSKREMIMKRSTISLLLLSALAIGAGSYAISTQIAKRSASATPNQSPRIEVPFVVHLGIIETGQTARGQFVITNRGVEDLILSSIRSDCGCLGVFRFQPEDGLRVPMSTATIKPGEQIHVELHFLVRGETGRPIEQAVHLETNDPMSPEVRVACSAIPGGTVAATPNSLLVGAMRPGEVKRANFEIRDDRRLGGCRITRVESSNPKAVAPSYMIADVEEPGTDRTQLGRLMGRVVVTVTAPSSSTPIDESIRVFVDGLQEPLLTVPVTAKVEPRFQLHPAVIAMPRASASGLAYSGRFIAEPRRHLLSKPRRANCRMVLLFGSMTWRRRAHIERESWSLHPRTDWFNQPLIR